MPDTNAAALLPERPLPLTQIREAIGLLRRARRLLRLAHAKRAAGAARRAIKSAEGAERHALCVAGRVSFG